MEEEAEVFTGQKMNKQRGGGRALKKLLQTSWGIICSRYAYPFHKIMQYEQLQVNHS